MIRTLAWCLMTVSLAAAVFLHGGVVPQEWTWSALGFSIGATIWVVIGPSHERAPGRTWGLAVLTALLGWMLLQLVPLPPVLVKWLSPEHWRAVAAARSLMGQDATAWVPLSVAPPATFGRLLDVLPAMAVFIAAREMAWWFRERIWIAIAPVVAIAWLESVLGLVQFYDMRLAGGIAGSVTGTYVNRNHYSGLLEMALPVAIVWTVSSWKKNKHRYHSAGTAVATAMLMAVSACLLMGVILSLSRMGFISTLVAAAVILLLLVASRHFTPSGWKRWRWVIAIGILSVLAVVLPTQELVLRFAGLVETGDLSRDVRVGIWQDTLRMTSDYTWAGCGLGAYEPCLYRYKTTSPVNTVDFAHNDYLQIFAELGVIGSALAAVLAGWIFWRALFAVVWLRGIENWYLAVGLLGTLVILGIHSLADFNLYIPANAAAFAWLAGVAVSPGLRS